MSVKRKENSSSFQASNTKAKRPRHNTHNDGLQSTTNNGRGPMDQTYGQYGAFPMNVDDIDPDDTTYQEAMAYLQGVRSEAHGIPHLLVAPAGEPGSTRDDDRGTHDEDAMYGVGGGDARGYYTDGVYMAAPTLGPSLPSESDSINNIGNEIDEADSGDHGGTVQAGRRRLTTPSQAHHTSLLSKFAMTRSRLRRTLPPARLGTLDDARYPTIIDHSKPLHNQQLFWIDVIASRAPHPLQLIAMTEDTVYDLVGVLPRVLAWKYLSGRRRDKRDAAEPRRESKDEGGTATGEQELKRSNVKNIGAWMWSLLARVPDVDTLDAGEVGLVRDVGKRAVRIICEMAEKATLQPSEPITMSNEVDKGSGEGDDDVHDEDIEKEQLDLEENDELLAQTDYDKSALLALLDMVLTIVGEGYRQRDLLGARDLLWESGGSDDIGLTR